MAADFREIVETVARWRGVRPWELVNLDGRKRPEVSTARHIAIYLHVTLCDLTAYRATKIWGVRWPSTIRYALTKIEDMRDDVEFDAFLERLEEELR